MMSAVNTKKESGLRQFKGIGPQKEAILNKAGVNSVRDLLYYFPFRYEDRRDFKNINNLKVGETAVLKAVVSTVSLKKMPYFIRSKKVKSIFEISLEDDTGKVKCVWFNQPYLCSSIIVGKELIVYGKLYRSKQGFQIISPEYEFVGELEPINVGRIVGVYSLPSELNQKFIRKVISYVLKDKYSYSDPVPYRLREEMALLDMIESFKEIHFPTSWELAKRARERFIFEELFISQVAVYLRKARHRLQKSVEIKIGKVVINSLRKNLSFLLTSSQEKVLLSIFEDLSKSYPMHRLLQGDVGCGKTVVAAFAIAVCADCGLQIAFMVPTEVLAHQHKETLEIFFRGLDFFSKKSEKPAIAVITSSLSSKESAEILRDLADGKILVVVGTHSLIQEKVKFKNLGLVVIDEQHKFGVAQRSLLCKKGDIAPNFLVMSATPIPRSLALSLYGDLDISIIDDMPKGRLLPETTWVREDKRKWVYSFLHEKLTQGRQVYIVYPVIEESSQEDLKSLESMYGAISKEFADFKVVVFHGKMKNEEKLKIIDSFRTKKADILLSTTVVEVGVNIENATVMVVENPERFGLAQLHQLRGRIQRSNYKPYFIIISSNKLSSNSLSRLEIISKETCGFVIAEEDLKIRGPGDFFGNLQHGLPDLKIANPLRDMDILKKARIAANNLVKDDPSLCNHLNQPIKEYLGM